MWLLLIMPSECGYISIFHNQKHMYDNSAPDYLYLTVLAGSMSDNPSYSGLCNECGNASNYAFKIDILLHLKEFTSDMELDNIEDKIKH